MILITGATGFLGAELVKQLTDEGALVRAIKRQQSVIPVLLKDNPLIKWFIADINDTAALEEAFEGVTQVYHCAALVSFNPKDKKQLFHTNIQGTANVVNLCIQHNCRLVHVSSIAALGKAKKGEQITEKNFWEYDVNAHAYGLSKYESEMEVWRGIAEGLDAVIVNPSVIIGKNAGFTGSGSIFKLVKNGFSYYTKGATGIVDVVDVAKTMILLMGSQESAERYIVSAENIYHKDLLTAIANGFNVKAPNKEAKPWMLAIAWRAAKFVSFFTQKKTSITKDTAKSSLNISLYNNSKIKTTLNTHFKPIPDSIKEICASLT